MFLKFLDDCEDYCIAGCDFKLGPSLQHWCVTLGDVALSRANNLRTRLLEGLRRLGKRCCCFRYRNNQLSSTDTSCKLCSASVDDTHHFIAVCPSLHKERVSLIADASPTVRTHLPDPSTRPEEYTRVSRVFRNRLGTHV